MFCYHCPPLHSNGAQQRLPSLEYPFAPTHPCKSLRNLTQGHINIKLQLSKTLATPITLQSMMRLLSEENKEEIEQRLHCSRLVFN